METYLAQPAFPASPLFASQVHTHADHLQLSDVLWLLCPLACSPHRQCCLLPGIATSHPAPSFIHSGPRQPQIQVLLFAQWPAPRPPQFSLVPQCPQAKLVSPLHTFMMGFLSHGRITSLYIDASIQSVFRFRQDMDSNLTYPIL